MSIAPIIRCEACLPGFQFNYDGRPLDLELFPGEKIHMIGPDYSGKSSWTRVITGIDQGQAGKVSIFDKDLLEYQRDDWVRLRREIAYIESDTALMSAANSMQNVMMPALYHDIDTPENIQRNAEELLSEIVPEADVYVLPSQLRKDQRFRVAVARALILNPRALVLDDPFNSMDTATAKRFKKFLLKYALENEIMLLIVSHDVDYAQKHADRVMFVSKEGVMIFDDDNPVDECEDVEVQEFLKLNTHR